jgi:hypothetical protein
MRAAAVVVREAAQHFRAKDSEALLTVLREKEAGLVLLVFLRRLIVAVAVAVEARAIRTAAMAATVCA